MGEDTQWARTIDVQSTDRQLEGNVIQAENCGCHCLCFCRNRCVFSMILLKCVVSGATDEPIRSSGAAAAAAAPGAITSLVVASSAFNVLVCCSSSACPVGDMFV